MTNRAMVNCISLLFSVFAVGLSAGDLVTKEFQYSTDSTLNLQQCFDQLFGEAKKINSSVRSISAVRVKPVKDGFEKLTEKELEENRLHANRLLAEIKSIDGELIKCVQRGLGDWQTFCVGEALPEGIALQKRHPMLLGLNERLFGFAKSLMSLGIIVPKIAAKKLQTLMKIAKEMDVATQGDAEVDLEIIVQNMGAKIEISEDEPKCYSGDTLEAILRDKSIVALDEAGRIYDESMTVRLGEISEQHQTNCAVIKQRFAQEINATEAELKSLQEKNIKDGLLFSPNKSANARLASLQQKEAHELEQAETQTKKLKEDEKEAKNLALRIQRLQVDEYLSRTIQLRVEEIVQALKEDPDLSIEKSNVPAYHPLEFLLQRGLVRSALTLAQYGLAFKDMESARGIFRTLNIDEKTQESLVVEGKIEVTKLSLIAWREFGLGTQKEANNIVEEVKSANQSFLQWTWSLLPSFSFSWWWGKNKIVDKPETGTNAQELSDEERLLTVSKQIEANENAQRIFFGPFHQFVND